MTVSMQFDECESDALCLARMHLSVESGFVTARASSRAFQ
jgi:hypothetical protein